MVETKTVGSRVFKVVNYIILTILAISCLYPLWYELLRIPFPISSRRKAARSHSGR